MVTRLISLTRRLHQPPTPARSDRPLRPPGMLGFKDWCPSGWTSGRSAPLECKEATKLTIEAAHSITPKCAAVRHAHTHTYNSKSSSPSPRLGCRAHDDH